MCGRPRDCKQLFRAQYHRRKSGLIYPVLAMILILILLFTSLADQDHEQELELCLRQSPCTPGSKQRMDCASWRRGGAGAGCRQTGSTSGWRTWGRAKNCGMQSSAAEYRRLNTAGVT